MIFFTLKYWNSLKVFSFHFFVDFFPLIFQFLWIIYFSPKAFFMFLLLKKYWQCYLKCIFFSILAAKWKFKVNPESKTTATRPCFLLVSMSGWEKWGKWFPLNWIPSKICFPQQQFHLVLPRPWKASTEVDLTSFVPTWILYY